MNSEVLLRGADLTRRWGGLVAVNQVSLELTRGSVHAVIGTNGAGKSTLINLLSGELPPSEGRVELMGHDITDWTPATPRPRGPWPQLSAQYPLPQFLGAGKLPDLRAGESAASLGVVDARTSDAVTMQAARDAAARAGLSDLLERSAGLLSHGQKRQLEIAMCLATAPQVLLLDEPLAGMGADETERMLALLADLKEAHAILLVEHDMDAVFRIAECITVMVDGAVIASGCAGRCAQQPERSNRLPRRPLTCRPSSSWRRAASMPGTVAAMCFTGSISTSPVARPSGCWVAMGWARAR